MIHIFPTNRAIRSFYTNLPQNNQFLPKAYSIQAFFEYALHVKNRQRADNLIRTLCMEVAIDFDAFELLHIPKNFMAFVKHEEYLFRFFEELSAEEVSFDTLRGADTYALYDEHLSILESVYERYSKELENRGFYDSTTLPKLAILDLDFIHQAKEITLHHEGYLSNFELRLFNEIASHIPLHVKMHSTPFNTKETKRIFNTNIPQNRSILGLMNSSKIHFTQQNLNLQVICSSFSQRSFQVGFVFDQIARFIQQGVAPENIAVVLPDESFATYLHTYDKNRVLNFAMGISVAKSRLYEHWNANFIFYNQQNQENLNRQNRFGEIPQWKEAWKSQINYEQFLHLLGDFSNEQKALKEIIEKQLARFERLFAWRGPMVFTDVLGLFLHELSSQSLDDVGGGPVTVLGLLETRGVSYEGVIIPDFNNAFIPKRSQKDWFLSSNLRAHANLPDSQARENLQRHYYYQIITRAKHKAISYVQNEQSMPSHFLHTFEPEYLEYDLISLAQTFMPAGPELEPHFEILNQAHKIANKPISASRLKTLLNCPRQYYYKYIEHLDEAKLPHDGIDALEIGNAIHSALEKLYLAPLDERIFTHKNIWLNELKTNLKGALPYSLHWELESGIWANRFEKICQIEIDRFKEGWRPWKLEERLMCKYEEFTLEGRIDRIDRHEDGRLLVLDYKTGATMQAGPKKIENRIDFQLIFYHLLASTLGKVENVGYYDLTQGEISYEKSLEPSLNRLLEQLRANKILTEFEQTIKRSTCTRCPYATLCQRKSGWN